MMAPTRRPRRAEAANIGKKTGAEHDAERRRCATPNTIQYDLDLGEITEVWRRGSVVASWLLDLTAQAFVTDENLSKFAGSRFRFGQALTSRRGSMSGACAGAHCIALRALQFARRSRFPNKVLSAMRFGFGGHLETPKT